MSLYGLIQALVYINDWFREENFQHGCWK